MTKAEFSRRNLLKGAMVGDSGERSRLCAHL